MEYLKKAAPRAASEISELSASVAGIIRRVREEKDEALIDYNMRFDGNSRRSLRVTQDEIREAYSKITERELDDMKRAASNIRRFAEAQRECLKGLDGVTLIDGSRLGHRVIPVESCGSYVPGGS